MRDYQPDFHLFLRLLSTPVVFILKRTYFLSVADAEHRVMYYMYSIYRAQYGELQAALSTLVPNTADRGSDVGQTSPKLMTMGGWGVCLACNIVHYPMMLSSLCLPV